MICYTYVVVLIFALAVSIQSFTAPRQRISSIVRSNTINRQISSISLGAKKATEPEVNNEYWQGEWVCADCGYVYDRDIDGGGLYFEQQKRGFICPQCSAPRKRYAKKVGDQWGVTRDGGDLPIYAFSFLGLAITAYFALVVVPTL